MSAETVEIKFRLLMDATSTIQETLDRIAQLIHSRFPAVAVYLYGSGARDQLRADSDLDVAVLFEEEPQPLELLDLREDVSGVAGRPVDLVSLNRASPILAMQVFRYGKPLMMRERCKWSLYCMKMVTMYNDLKIVRRPIEQNILRGQIFDR